MATPPDAPGAAQNPEIERALEAEIDPWLAHMRWRADFDEWRTRRLRQEDYQQEQVAEARAFLDGPRPARVLDLGAGMGGFAVAMQRTGTEIVALDFNPAYCKIARTRARRYALNLAALVGAGEALPFATGSFQLVTCWDVLEHVAQPERLLSEIGRVLTTNGTLLITVINRLALVDPHYHLRFVNYVPRPVGESYIALRGRTKESALRDKQKLSEMHYYRYDAFVRLAAQLGFRVQDLQESKSRFNAYPRIVASALYGSWRTFGMGTFRLALRKEH